MLPTRLFLAGRGFETMELCLKRGGVKLEAHIIHHLKKRGEGSLRRDHLGKRVEIVFSVLHRYMFFSFTFVF